MAYYMTPCRCMSENPAFQMEKRNDYSPAGQPSADCCAPCGKIGWPEKGARTDNASWKKHGPLLDMLETDRKVALRMYVENHAEIRRASDFTKIRVNSQIEQSREDLEQRSQKLRALVDQEMCLYEMQIRDELDMSNQKETHIEKMKSRVTELRQKREEHEKKIIEKSRREQMGPLLSKRMTKQITKDWDAQIWMKRRLEAEHDEEERMWAYLWAKDAEEKWRREEAFREMYITRGQKPKSQAVEIDVTKCGSK